MLFGLDNSHRVVSKYFFYNLAKLVLEQASKIRFWDLEKLRLELRKSPSYIFKLENSNTNSQMYVIFFENSFLDKYLIRNFFHKHAKRKSKVGIHTCVFLRNNKNQTDSSTISFGNSRLFVLYPVCNIKKRNHEFIHSPIHEFKVLHKSQNAS